MQISSLRDLCVDLSTGRSRDLSREACQAWQPAHTGWVQALLTSSGSARLRRRFTGSNRNLETGRIDSVTRAACRIYNVGLAILRAQIQILRCIDLGIFIIINLSRRSIRSRSRYILYIQILDIFIRAKIYPRPWEQIQQELF